MIRIEAVWLAVDPPDMRASTDTAPARVLTFFGHANPLHAYLFTNRRANRLKVLALDGLAIWLCARRQRQGKFTWAGGSESHRSIKAEQALVIGLPWHRIGEQAVIRMA